MQANLVSRVCRRAAVQCVAALVLSCLSLAPAGAATFVVDRTDNVTTAGTGNCTAAANDCTLRGAVTAANTAAGDDTITFDATVFATAQTITIPNGLPNITTNLSIVGTGRGLLTLSGAGGATRLLFIGNATTVSLQNMTLSGSSASNGGALFNDGGTVTLSGLTFSGNTSTAGGGAVYNSNNGSMTVSNCSFSNNTSSTSGGALISQAGPLLVRNCTFTTNTSNATTSATGGGAIYSNSASSLKVIDSSFAGNSAPNGGSGGGVFVANSPALITNSTFSGNSAANNGGGAIVAIAASAMAIVTNCTLSGNSAAAGLGGGLRRSSGASVTLRNTIVADSISGGDCSTAGDPVNFSNSLVEDGSCGISGGTNKTGDPALGAFTNGYFPLTSGSPAVDAGDNSYLSEASANLDYNGDGDTTDTLSTDQRGLLRRIPLGGTVDMGAYEFDSAQAGPGYVVTVNSDETDGFCGVGHCTLREAMGEANSNVDATTITFDAVVTGTLQLNSALPALGTDVTISGPGANLLAVRGEGSADQYRIFNIASGVSVSISGLSITNGHAPDGANGLNGGSGSNGGAILNSGTLTLTAVAISGNQAGNGGNSIAPATQGGIGGSGGGIANGGTLLVISSTVSGNQAGVGGTGTAAPSGLGGFGGGIANAVGATTTVSSSTVSGNTASGSSAQGGGIVNLGTLTVASGTVTANSATLTGGGIHQAAGPSTLTLRNTIVASNTASVGPDILGLVQSEGFNLVRDTTNSSLNETQNPGTNLTGVDPKLGPLANNGGPTRTHALLFSSPAIDKGDDFSLTATTDQRGQTRPFDQPLAAPATGGDDSDIGAYEVSFVYQTGSPSFVVNSVADTDDGACTDEAGGCTLREAINIANIAAGADTITFDLPGAGPHTIQLDSVLPVLSTSIDILNTSGEAITVRGEGATDPYRIFTVSSGQTVNISNLTLANGAATIGSAPGNQGGAIYSQGTLTLTACTITANSANFGGGIYNTGGGTLALTNSTVRANSASSNGGGILNAATLIMTGSTVSGNSAGNQSGGIQSTSNSSLTNCTISGNTANVTAGMYCSSGTHTLTNVTVTGNNAITNVGGIQQFSGSVQLRNTIVAGNTGGGDPDVYNNFVSLGDNLIGKRNGSWGSTGWDLTGSNGDLTGTVASPLDPKLGPLANNGGLTWTHAVLYGSPALNTVGNGNEVQTVTPGGTSGGTFILAFKGQTTSPLSFTTGSSPSVAAVQAALEALGTIGAGNVLVSGSNGGPFTVTFQGALGGANQPLIQTNSTTGGTTCSTALVSDGGFSPATDQRGVARPQGSAADIGAFEAVAAYSIVGYVRTNTLTPVVGVSVQLSAPSGLVGAPVTTDANGFYSINNLYGGGYLITPTLAGWSFSPTAQNINISNASRGANFIATRVASTYSVSGRASDRSGQALVGVSVALTPAAGGTVNPVTTNSAGYYSFTNIPDGDYVITPTRSGTTFSLPIREIAVSGANITGQNFIGSTGYSISGRISDAIGGAIAGATVTIPGVGTTTSNSAGYYAFYNVPDGEYTATPSKSGTAFIPADRSITINGADSTNQNFVGSTGYTVSGRIATSSGIGISGVTVTLNGGVTATTNSAGYYTFYNVPNGTHTLVPSKAGTTFIPGDKTVQVNDGNLSGQNFTGTS